MTVYLVPVGDQRYQLYVEIPPDTETDPPEGERRGWIGRQVLRFRTMLAEAEQARLKRERGEPDEGSGLWQAILRKVAEAVAEQRLLWQLRHQTHVTVAYPDDITSTAALAEVRAEFTRDVARHRRWMIIDAIAVAITARSCFCCQVRTLSRGTSRSARSGIFCPGAVRARASTKSNGTRRPHRS